MRTVDPDLWSKKVKKPLLDLTTPYKFGLVQSQLEVRLRNSFNDAMKEFWRNCSVQGVKFMTDTKINTSMRWCYLILIMVSTVSGVSIIVVNWRESPLVVNELMTRTALSNITFPAVAICSYNIISKAALDKYAQYLFSLDKNNTYTLSVIKDNLMAFGAIQTMSFTNFDPNFMKYLAEVARETNVTRIIYKLFPQCSSLLVRCYWRARRFRCAELFAARVTPLGFCCIFNSRYLPEDTNSAIYKVNRTGLVTGLSIVVRENTDDFAYIRRSGSEIQVLLFDGNQYPLLVGGVIRSYLAQRNSTMLVKLKVHAQHASSDLRHYSDRSKGCRMVGGGDGYDINSWSICMTRCQRNAAIALCSCAPYYLPAYDSVVAAECSLEHLECLAKHKEMFMYFYPGESADESLHEEEANSLVCTGGTGPSLCLPDCARLLHTGKIGLLQHQTSLRVLKNRLMNGLDLTNTTIIRLYYTSDIQQLSMIDIYISWFDIAAQFGCKSVLLVAITVISVAEFTYYCTVRWVHHYRRRKRL